MSLPAMAWLIAGAGLESVDGSRCANGDLGQSPNSSGAESGAVGHGTFGPNDDDLDRVVHAWPELPKPIRAGILAMIEATRRHTG